MQPAYRRFIGPVLAILLVSATVVAGLTLRARAPGEKTEQTVLIKSGEGFWSIATTLERAGVIRSRTAFSLYSLFSGAATRLKAGTYLLGPDMSTPFVVRTIALGLHREAEVVIPEGASLYEVDALLTEAGIVMDGDIVRLASLSSDIEGTLFPDTYRLFVPSEAAAVVEKMRENFKAKAEPLLPKDPVRAKHVLVLASLLEKEVPDDRDRRVVAGILEKRLAARMPLQVDATICYLKQVERGRDGSCYPLDPLDFKIDSPYNTYLYQGLPPHPIGSPGAGAIRAALDPQKSPYWFYLSDPRTKKTVFSQTLDEHTRNRVKYLSR